MTNKNSIYDKEITEALKKKDFNFLFSFFQEKQFVSTDLIIFYKKNNKGKRSLNSKKFPFNVFDVSEYWTSKLPLYYLKDILGSDIKISFLDSYFKDNTFCNNELNEKLFEFSKFDFIKFFKINKAYKHICFFDFLRLHAIHNTNISIFFKEIDFIQKFEARIIEEEKKDLLYFLKYDFNEIAIAFTLYYYNFKQTGNTLNNKDYQTRIENALICEFDRILNTIKCKKKICFNCNTNSELQNIFNKYKAPHRILGKEESHSELHPKYLHLLNLIKNAIKQNADKCDIDLYTSGFADFEWIFECTSKLRTNSYFKTFRFNDIKSYPEEHYFLGKTIDNMLETKISRTDVNHIIKTLSFYGIPLHFNYKSQEINIINVYKLLKHFSAFKGPLERNFIELQNQKSTYYELNKADDFFINCLGTNESISLFIHDDLVKGISKYFNWGEVEVESILNFLSYQLNDNNYKNWILYPFIKIDNTYLWMGGFCKDRRWENLLINRFIVENQKFQISLKNYKDKIIVCDVARLLELQVEKLFSSAGYKTIHGLKFKNADGQSGEIDVLAYKDNCLFICEVKSSQRTDSYATSAYHENVRLEGCAAEQLIKYVQNINENWNEIKTKLKCPSDLKIGSVNIIPLIITDYFEGDLQLYKDEFRKISLLELSVIFNNTKKELLQLFLILQYNVNRFNESFKKDFDLSKDWDLWKGKKDLDIETIVECIDNNAIWKDLEGLLQLNDLEFELVI